jgi:hypothetical protein
MFFFAYKALVQNQKYLVPAFFCFGLSLQFQILNCIFVFPLLALYFLFGHPKINLKVIGASLCAFVLAISSFIVFDLRHQFLMLKTFLNHYFLSGGQSTFGFNPLDYWQRLSLQAGHLFFPGIKAGWLILAFMLTYTLVMVIKKKDGRFKLLLVWIFSTLPIFVINSRMSQSAAAFIGTSGGMFLLASALIDWLTTKKKSIFLLFIAIAVFTINLYALDNYLVDPHRRLFDFFQGQFLERNLALVEWGYQEANGEKFQLDTVTSPLLISPLWDYLFQWHAQKNHLSPPTRGANIHFLVIEPFVDHCFKDGAIREKEAIGELIKEETFGMTVIQKWQTEESRD